MERMVLEATEFGLGTCWIGNFNEEKVKEVPKISEEYKVIALLAIDYPYEKFDIQRNFFVCYSKEEKIRRKC